MQPFVLLGIALCLVAETAETKSVTSFEDNTADLSVRLHGKAEDNPTAESCQCENGFCEKDEKGKLVCKCPPEWGSYSATYCKKCDCGKDSNCTFTGFWTTTKTCICKVGYKDVNGICKDIPLSSTSTPEETTRTPTVQSTSSLFTHSLNFTVDRNITVPSTTIVSTTSRDVCYPNPCKNGGTCNAIGGEATCQCKDRFRGADCSIDICYPNPCKNGGTCNTTRGEATCQCKDRFRGTDCSIDVCYPNPCKNGGICKAREGEATCQCKDRFRGADCSLDVCSPNPCRNGGVCNVTRKGAICQCRDHFRGADCSIEIPLIAISTSTTRIPTIQPTSSPSSHSLNFTGSRDSTAQFTTIVPTTGGDPCTESPCQNGGTCVTVGNTRKCLCKKPYLGNLCETDPCDWNPCKNGGVCKIEYETVRCFCREPFRGDFCESRIRTDTFVITLVGGSVFLAVILTFATCILCQKYHAMRSRSEYS